MQGKFSAGGVEGVVCAVLRPINDSSLHHNKST